MEGQLLCIAATALGRKCLEPSMPVPSITHLWSFEILLHSHNLVHTIYRKYITYLLKKFFCSVKKQFILILELHIKWSSLVNIWSWLGITKTYFLIFFSLSCGAKWQSFVVHRYLGHETFIQWHLPSRTCALWNELSLVGFSAGTGIQSNSQLIEIEESRWIPYFQQSTVEITGAASWETAPSTSSHLERMSNVLFYSLWTDCAMLSTQKICRILSCVFLSVLFCLLSKWMHCNMVSDQNWRIKPFFIETQSDCRGS